MPKQTFFNLPSEKQEHLMESIGREFSRVPLNEASIANIVKYADIPRGSFYQYFEDKEDAYYYLLEEQTKDLRTQFILLLKEHDGDLFLAFTQMFQIMLTMFQDQELQSFFKNTFLHMDYKVEKKLAQNFSARNRNKQVTELLTIIKVDNLNVANDQEVIHAIEIIVAVTFQNLMHYFAKRYSSEEALEKYTFEMKLLKKGLRKKKC